MSSQQAPPVVPQLRSDAASEAYVINRYRLWRSHTIDFDYKKRKADRIAEIMAESGGLARTALEIGVGPAGIAVELSRLGMKIVGMDISPEALDRARAHSQSHDVALLRGSAFNIPLGSNTLSLIYASQVFHLFDSPQRLALLREIHRVLRPGGRLVFDMKNAWSHLFKYIETTAERRRRNYPRRAEILQLLRQAGFGSVTLSAGVLPRLGPIRLPDLKLFRPFAHTTFYIGLRNS